MENRAQPTASSLGAAGTGRPRGGHRDLSRAPGTAGPSQSIGHHGTIPVHRAPWAVQKTLQKISKMKPTPEEEPKEETLLDEKSGEHTTPGDEPKKESNSDENSWDETDHGDKRKDGDGPEDGVGGGPEDGPGGGPGDGPDSGPDDGPDDGPNNGDNPGGNGSGSGSGSGSAIKMVIGATVGAGVALVGLPAIFGALGLTGVGIAAGSVAAKMIMGADGDVAEDGKVAVLQTIGSAAYSLAVKTGLKTALRSVSAASGAWLSKWKKTPSDKPKETTNIQVTTPKNDKTQVTNPRKSNLGDKHEEKTTPDKRTKRSQAGS